MRVEVDDGAQLREDVGGVQAEVVDTACRHWDEAIQVWMIWQTQDGASRSSFQLDFVHH